MSRSEPSRGVTDRPSGPLRNRGAVLRVTLLLTLTAVLPGALALLAKAEDRRVQADTTLPFLLYFVLFSVAISVAALAVWALFHLARLFMGGVRRRFGARHV